MTEVADRAARRRFQWALMALLWVWMTVVLVVNLPGHLTHDSLTQIAEGRSGWVKSWNPIFSSWLFGRLVKLTGGTEVLVAMSTTMVAGSLLVLVGHSTRSHRLALIPVALLLFAPVLLVYPGIVWKDVWFAHLALLGFAFVALRLQGAGWWTEGVALLLLAAAMLSRQTGVLVALIGPLALALRPHRGDAVAGETAAPAKPISLGAGRRPHMKRLWSVIWRMLALFLLATALSQTARSQMKQVQISEVGTGLRLVALFDIAGMLQRLPDVQLNRLQKAGFETGDWEAAARATFSGERIDLLDLRSMRGPRDLDVPIILRQWRDLVLAHPLTYAAHRLHTYSWFLGLQQQSRCLPVHVGIEASPDTPDAGLRMQPSRWASSLYFYAKALFDTPYFAPLTWALVSLFVWVAMALHGQSLEAVAWLQVGGLLYGLSYAMAGFSCDFRYSYFPVLAASVGLMRWCADGLPLSRSQRA